MKQFISILSVSVILFTSCNNNKENSYNPYPICMGGVCVDSNSIGGYNYTADNVKYTVDSTRKLYSVIENNGKHNEKVFVIKDNKNDCYKIEGSKFSGISRDSDEGKELQKRFEKVKNQWLGLSSN